MDFGNKPVDGGNLLLSHDEVYKLGLTDEQRYKWIRKNYGGAEFIRGQERYCLWLDDDDLEEALRVDGIRARVEAVRAMRLSSPDEGANAMAARAHQMREMNIGRQHTIVVAAISSENRDYLPCGLIDNRSTINNKNYALYDAPLWSLAIIASRLHWVWIGTVCMRMRTDFSYSNTLGWNTFPAPNLTHQNQVELMRCAENILLAREAHFQPRSLTSTIPKRCLMICAGLTTGTMRFWSGSISGGGSAMTRNDLKNYLNSTPR